MKKSVVLFYRFVGNSEGNIEVTNVMFICLITHYLLAFVKKTIWRLIMSKRSFNKLYISVSLFFYCYLFTLYILIIMRFVESIKVY